MTADKQCPGYVFQLWGLALRENHWVKRSKGATNRGPTEKKKIATTLPVFFILSLDVIFNGVFCYSFQYISDIKWPSCELWTFGKRLIFFKLTAVALMFGGLKRKRKMQIINFKDSLFSLLSDNHSQTMVFVCVFVFKYLLLGSCFSGKCKLWFSFSKPRIT